MKQRLWLVAVLIVLGAAWGSTQPMMKIAVSDGYRHFGLIFWQFVFGALILGIILASRRRPLPLGPKQLRLYVIIALIGTILPNSASYEAARHLPAGVLSILMSTVPMFVFPIALMMGTDRFDWLRLSGLIVGLIGVSLQVRSRVVLLRQMRSEGWRNRAHWLDVACLTGHALVWWVGPSFVFGFGSVAAFQAAFLVAMGYTFFVMLAPAHLPAEAACFAPPPPDSDPVYRQVAATANFRAGRLGRWMCSGLDYQIEHHLFRAVPHTRLPALAELTRTFCAHHGYPYRELGWGEGLWKAAQSFATPKTVLEIAP